MNEFLLSSHASLSMRLCSVMLPTRLRPESDRYFLDLSVVKSRERNKKNDYCNSAASNDVSVEMCISYPKKIVIQLFTCYFLKINLF